MAAYDKDSAILEIGVADNGYFVRAWKWDISPPPVRHDLDGAVPSHTFRIDHVSTNKTELKAAIASFVDNVLNV